MSLPRIRDEFRVPARLGAQVTVTTFDETGTVTGCDGDYIEVTFNDRFKVYAHPTMLDWQTGPTI